ncbi:uncharacterized protein EDB93DRAFT_1247366 [Suillus bovinus]|uniref:uncharacterized protein n=1 Tax=Suillus bovinus TaxID=48563 RepID=UPI001B85D751|nr:uncharacterized protein EDB93DRAFT_1247366 [Suillus bovinus]KAG2156664.1 hypothetical protein EDB93DRAFT_1247366 [Suillus bovinus]
MPDVYESAESDALNDTSNGAAQPVPTRSIYALTRKEITRGIANRFVHSHTYIFLYLSMAALSVTTVVLSLADGCPGLSFYILEIIINTSMILEVGVRFVAFGRQFWRSPFNVLDLILTLFCAITLLVITFAGCGAGSKEEELLDTLLLIARNVLQFGRLAAVMRQSGQSIFSRPKPIDISAIRRAGYSSLDYDLEEDYQDDDPELGRPLVQDAVLFDAQDDEPPAHMSDMPRAAQAVHDRDDEDVWAELG